ncbi:MAG: TPM domain-containing protein [Alphaproteobacteria bacterium]|nr:TPM domain-containing protein [Alphaproteobacteria bacterium]
MTAINNNQRKAIQAAISEAETRTSAEFVTVIADAAEPYLFIPTFIAAFVTMVASGIVLMLQDVLPPFTKETFYAGQVLLFIVCAVVFRFPAVRFRLVPKAIRHVRASRMAHQLFLDLGLTETEDRNAVLLFVAMGERYVEVIADAGLQAKLEGPAVWDGVIEAFVSDVGKGRVANGFVAAIEGCADVMAAHFPNREGAPNRFPDRLIEL